MASHRHLEVLIVGAGPVGLFTALLLAKRDIHVRIIDRRERTNVHSYALALHPQSLRLLDGVGLATSVAAAGHWVETVEFKGEGNTGARVDLTALAGSYPYVVVVPQGALESRLEGALQQCGVRVEWDSELDVLEEQDGARQATIRRYQLQPQGYPVVQMHRMAAGMRHQSARYVIGTDGYHSSVRRALGIDYQAREGGRSFAVYEFESGAPPRHASTVVLANGRHNVLWPLGGGVQRWSFEISAASEVPDNPEQGLAKFIAERAPWFQDEVRAVRWSTMVRFERRVAATFGEGATWLAGDAAHCGNPIGVHSLNLGLKEAHELAWRLYDILRDEGGHKLLDEYNATRREEWLRMVGASGSLVPGPGANPWVAEHKDDILACTPCSGVDLRDALSQLHLDFHA